MCHNRNKQSFKLITIRYPTFLRASPNPKRHWRATSSGIYLKHMYPSNYLFEEKCNCSRLFVKLHAGVIRRRFRNNHPVIYGVMNNLNSHYVLMHGIMHVSNEYVYNTSIPQFKHGSYIIITNHHSQTIHITHTIDFGHNIMQRYKLAWQMLRSIHFHI
jgi:hypothetical protein